MAWSSSSSVDAKDDAKDIDRQVGSLWPLARPKKAVVEADSSILPTRCYGRRARRLDPSGGRFRRRQRRDLSEEWDSQSASVRPQPKQRFYG
jgi:hypothetical protein